MDKASEALSRLAYFPINFFAMLMIRRAYNASIVQHVTAQCQSLLLIAHHNVWLSRDG